MNATEQESEEAKRKRSVEEDGKSCDTAVMKIFEDIHSACKPSYYLSLITASTSIRRNEVGAYSRTFIQIFQSLIYLGAGTVATIMSLKEDAMPFPVIKRSGTLAVVSRLYFPATNFAAVSVFILSQVFANATINTIKDIDEVDIFLKGMGFRNVLLKANYLVWRFTIVVFLIVLSLYYGTIAACAFILYNFPKFQLIAFIISCCVNTATKLQYYLWAVILRERFKILKRLLKTKVQESSHIAKYPENDRLFEKDLENIIELHKKLIRIAKSINMIYSLLLVYYTTLNFIVLITQGYIVVYVLTFRHYKDEDNQSLVYNSLQFLLYTVAELLFMVRCTTLMCYQANSAIEVLHEISIHPEKVQCRNLVISTSLHLMHNKLEISACNLFNVDFAFLHSIFAAVTTYLIIMLQFDIDASKRSVIRTNSTT